MTNEKKEKTKKNIRFIWPTYFIILGILFLGGFLIEDYLPNLMSTFIIVLLIIVFPGMIVPMAISNILHSSISLDSLHRDMPLIKKDIRAVCPVDILLNNLQAALEDEIVFYGLKFAYDDVIYGIGYEKGENVSYFLLCGEVENKFNSIDEMKSALVFNHDVTVLDEFQSSDFMNVSKIMGSENVEIRPMNLKDNYILKSYVVKKDNDKYNLNIGSKIQEIMNNKN